MTSNITEDNIQTFVYGYIEGILWAEDYHDASFSDEAEEAIDKDCRAFLAQYGHLIASDSPKFEPQSDRWETAGNNFWLTRQGSGAGFWDGDWPMNGVALSEACAWDGPFGENVDVIDEDDSEVLGYSLHPARRDRWGS